MNRNGYITLYIYWSLINNYYLFSIVLYYCSLGLYSCVSLGICARLYYYLYDVEKNSMLNKSQNQNMPQNVVSKGKLRQTDRRNVLKNIQISFMTIISHKFFVIQGNSTSQGYSKRYSSHYFLGGVGITHMIVCTFFTALVLLVRYVIHATNLSEVYKTQSNKLHTLN